MGNQQGPTVQHRKLFSVMWQPEWDWVLLGLGQGLDFEGRMDTCTCMAESLRCSPETTTTLLIDYTPIQSKEFEKKKKEFVLTEK